MTDHREIEQLVKAALREVGEALTSLRDCGDRPGMYDQGASALSAYTTIRQELGRLATIAKTAEERVRELEEERDQFFLHANAHRAGEQRAEAALATEREARERAEAERDDLLARWNAAPSKRAAMDQAKAAEARAERAEEALRVIAEGESPRPHEDVAAEALSEIEKRLAQDEGEGA